MRRRLLVALPGIAALAAGRAFSETNEALASGGTSPHLSRKSLAKHSGLKSAYKIPKNAAKQGKYINSLSALLSLTSGQRAQTGAIFTTAATTRASIHASLKTARRELNDAVKNNDSARISQAATALGMLTGQHISTGALAHASVLQLLSPDQQSKLSQFKG
jgi:Spy/CpxP family protein refolding chaperone